VSQATLLARRFAPKKSSDNQSSEFNLIEMSEGNLFEDSDQQKMTASLVKL